MLGVHDLAPAIPPRRYPAPVSARRALAVVEMLRLPPGGRVLDLAADAGGLLMDAVAQSEGRGLGIVTRESDAEALRGAAASEGLGGRLDFALSTAFLDPAERFDAILSVQAATAVDGGPALETEENLRWLRVGGTLVVGEPFLRRTPSPRYRELLGDSARDLKTVGGTARSIVARGFELLVTAVLSETEWDAHESASFRATQAYAATLLDQRAAARLVERAESWYHAYWMYGRDTLGFAFQSFRKARVLEVLAPA